MSIDLLNNALQELSSAKGINTSVNQHLEAVAKRLQTDADFRIEIGQATNIWKDMTLILSKVVKEALDPQQVEQLMFLFRIVRNGVAGVTENQDHARDANLPQLIQEVVSQAAHTHYGNVAYIMMLRAGVQALSNLLTGNNASKDLIWKSFIVQAPSTSCDQNLLSTLAAIEDETIVLSTVVLCYNCVFESQERSALLFSTPAGKSLLRQLTNESHATSAKEDRKSFEMIYTFFDHLIGRDYFPELFEALKSQNGSEDEEEYSIRYHGENFHSQDNPIPKIQELRIEEVEDEEESSSKEKQNASKKKEHQRYLSQEQVILLKMADSKIYTHHEQQQKLYQKQHQHQAGHSTPSQPSCFDPFAVDETEPAVSQETVEYLTAVFGKASTLTIEIFKTLDQPGVGQHAVEDLANLSSGLMLLLGCLSHLSLHEDGHVLSATNAKRANDEDDDEDDDEDEVEEEIERMGEIVPVPEWFKAQHMAMVNGGLVESAIELLRQADKSLARVTKPVTAMPANPEAAVGTTATSTPAMSANTESTLLSNTSTMQGQKSFFVGLKRDIVRLVGNLTYRSRHVQDRIRNCNGLIVMLSQCNIDDANPYLREYGILAMKNILAGNAENQALIEELQPIEAVDHPALQEARVTSRLDAETGRPILTQTKPTSL
ncbi:hypothetical protein BG011_003522 [Mortierella polycephala]|uniref:Ataxin-10 homolog n=1 Tax=Mortierella polycephala TaxID=41804 RepID=A0A9P6Q0Y0_9FUNG|nr:hypothetical protein BG011_003522 [Mortierella polycephala]